MAKDELKRLSGVIEVIDDNINEIVYKARSSDVKVRERKKNNI